MAQAEYTITVSVRRWAIPLVWILVQIPGRWMGRWWVKVMTVLTEVE